MIAWQTLFPKMMDRRCARIAMRVNFPRTQLLHARSVKLASLHLLQLHLVLIVWRASLPFQRAPLIVARAQPVNFQQLSVQRMRPTVQVA